MKELEVIVEPLLEWFYKNKRELPWRSDPTPYHVWISEIMLQQTRVEAVKEYYKRFLNKLPDVSSLASVSDEELMKLWEGLGYYNRARNLKKAAGVIVKEYEGVIPGTYEELLTLPGIGSYTAGAISSIAYKKKVPAVDGNVLRVVMRVLGCFKNIDDAKTKKWLEEELIKILPEDVSSFNQALMELGALVCVPNGEPHCMNCPLQKYCKTFEHSLFQEIPVRKEKKKRRIEEKTVFIFYSKGKVALLKRKETGLLAGLYEFPNYDKKMTQKEVLKYLKEKKIEALKIEELPFAKHIFSHVEWHMQGYKIILDDFFETEEYIWSDLKDLNEKYAIPSAFITYLELVKKEIE